MLGLAGRRGHDVGAAPANEGYGVWAESSGRGAGCGKKRHDIVAAPANECFGARRMGLCTDAERVTWRCLVSTQSSKRARSHHALANPLISTLVCTLLFTLTYTLANALLSTHWLQPLYEVICERPI